MKELNTKLDFVAGISPQYWSYVPMSVMDVLNLKLKDGINWMIPSQKSSDGGEEFLSPVSRCLLVGCIVYAAQRRDGSMVYILDDGTGIIDCVQWLNDTQQDIYNLPSLSDNYDDKGKHFSVGNVVRIFGKIECLALMSKIKTKETNDNGNHNHNDDYTIREIHTSTIERVENDTASEAHHWIQSSCHLGRVNVNSCLESLGPQIQLQINNKVNLPAADDIYSCSWRVFGMNCCCNLTYMEDLLYCHCQSKAEPLDPSYLFRDAVLTYLQSMQHRTVKRLQFKYKQIKNNDNLQTIASREIFVEKHDREKKNTLIDKLFLKTFSALRNDGIIHLLNSNTDEYLLITRDKVLEPYIRSQIKNPNMRSSRTKTFVSYKNSPPYISRVHNERLLYIKRLIQQDETNSKKDG